MNDLDLRLFESIDFKYEPLSIIAENIDCANFMLENSDSTSMNTHGGALMQSSTINIMLYKFHDFDFDISFNKGQSSKHMSLKPGIYVLSDLVPSNADGVICTNTRELKFDKLFKDKVLEAVDHDMYGLIIDIPSIISLKDGLTYLELFQPKVDDTHT